ncbi:MAG: type II toxin-antitoxin system PemK/MazF family toxin [Candidatus Vogelbacteria bacterium]|nr:type II toxin-antitoxin system PemK/MazF family toxin [Candidatus Vogelbacteria bacterium]
MVKKYDIVLINLDPSKGAEKRGLRPCLILQNDLANASRLQTVTVAPFTKHMRNAPSMQAVKASKDNGMTIDSSLDLSQIRTIDKDRITKIIGRLEVQYWSDTNDKIINFLDLRNEYLY